MSYKAAWKMEDTKMEKIFVNKVQSEESYDVIVIGGGSTGICAAIASARGGAKTAIIEYYGFLGGNAVCGIPWMGFHNFHDKQMVVKGIPLELIERLRKVGGASEFHLDPICSSTVAVNGSLLKMILAEMVQEEKIDVYLHSLASGVEMEENHIVGVYIQNKQGCQLLKAKVVIDCTDTADVAVMAGAGYEFGRNSDNKVQVSSYIHNIGGIDVDKMIDYFEENPDQMRPFNFSGELMKDLLQRMRTTPVFILGAFPKLIEKAKQDGIDYDRDRLIGVVYTKTREMVLVASRVGNVNPNDVRNFSHSELMGMRQTRGIMEFINKYMPGGETAYLKGSGHQIGIRETRHIFGDYYLTAEDLLSGKNFDDAVALGAYHLDIHSPDHNGVESRKPPIYKIPYRSLLPKGIEGILVAGRGTCADHEAYSSIRVISISGAIGQGAGTAAAIAVKSNIAPRYIDAKILQAKLMEDGAEIGQGIIR